MAKKRGTSGREAELLFEKWLRFEGWTYHRAAAAGVVKRPDGSVFCKSHDLFGCLDFLAFRFAGYRAVQTEIDRGGTIAPRWEVWGAQVTTQGGRSARREKLAAVTWPTAWRISLVSHERVPDPADRNKSRHFWKVEDMGEQAVAVAFDPREVEAAWKAWREARGAGGSAA